MVKGKGKREGELDKWKIENGKWKIRTGNGKGLLSSSI